jgi:hypothetical protein
MAVVKIGLPYPSPGVTVARFGKMDMVVPYTIDGTGTFSVRLPLESYTPIDGEAEVRKQAQAQISLQNKEFSL